MKYKFAKITRIFTPGGEAYYRDEVRQHELNRDKNYADANVDRINIY